MKTLLTLFVLLFSSSVFAEDISDFEIEGMSVGDSLLDYMSEKKIQDGIKHDYYKYKSNKFDKVEFWDLDLEIYDVLSAHIKTNDKNYIIYELSGAILFEENVSDCYLEKNKIDNELYLLFDNVQRYDSGRQFHPADETNQSTYDRVDLFFPSGNTIDIICYDWSETKGFNDHLSVGMEMKEFSKWIND